MTTQEILSKNNIIVQLREIGFDNLVKLSMEEYKNEMQQEAEGLRQRIEDLVRENTGLKKEFDVMVGNDERQSKLLAMKYDDEILLRQEIQRLKALIEKFYRNVEAQAARLWDEEPTDHYWQRFKKENNL